MAAMLGMGGVIEMGGIEWGWVAGRTSRLAARVGVFRVFENIC